MSTWFTIATPKSAWARALGTLGGGVLGAVLLVAAAAKAVDPIAFAAEIERQGLAVLLPAEAIALVALALEVALGAALVLGVRRGFVLWPAAALVVFFLFLTGRTWWQDAHGTLVAEEGCGCFGKLVERTPAEAFWQDLALLVPALLAAFAGRRAELAWPYSPSLPRWRLATAGVMTVAVVLLAWKAPELPLDDVATRLRPGVEVAGLCAGADGDEICLDTVLPELADGEHVVILADLAGGELGSQVERLNEYHWAGRGPALWVLTSAAEDEIFEFRFHHALPAFELREAPAALLAPLHRTLPRSFLARQGEVVETWSGLPPIDRLAGDGEAPAEPTAY